MYEFHYDYIKPKYEYKAKLLVTNADRLVNKITTDDFYADTKDDIESKFDASEYSKDHPAALVPELGGLGFKVGCNKKIVSMMKNETTGKKSQ